MKVCRLLLVNIVLLGLCVSLYAKDPSMRRARELGIGMNVTYLDQYWNGTKSKDFSDFANEKEILKRKHYFKDVKKAGFDSVRIPINFGAWATIKKPYRWRDKKYLTFPDRFIKWALEADLKVIVDLHHVEFDKTVKGTATTERINWIWGEVAKRYKGLDPDKVLFELRNEPHDIKAEEWRAQAKTLIKTVRSIAPKHTLVIGFHDWNSRAALIKSKPFKADNIIYTFHYYDPFIFTHQGATWAGDGLKPLRSVPFPFDKKYPIKKPASAGSWVSGQIDNYQTLSDASKMFRDLKEAKDWSERHKVPIFAGEFGSYSRFATQESRCRHASVVYGAMKRLKIPNAWWEWDGGFSMFDKGTENIAGCMRKAIRKFD